MEDHEVVTRAQQWGEFEAKWAEASNTHLMPGQASPRPKVGPSFPIKKSGSAVPPDDTLEAQVAGEQPAKNPQAGALNPRVDVAGKEPPKVIKEKQAQLLALPSQGRYPLDSYEDVKTASAYFEEHRGAFAPHHRHEFCSNLAQRAETLGLGVSDEVAKYGSATYASAPEIEVCLDARRSIIHDESALDVLDKLAMARPSVEPEVFAGALHEFDKMAGVDVHYDGDVPDPFYTTFGLVKQAEENQSWTYGNDVIYAKDIKRMATGDCTALAGKFGDDFCKEFKKDPIAIFSSMPVDQKKIIGRLAASDDEQRP